VSDEEREHVRGELRAFASLDAAAAVEALIAAEQATEEGCLNTAKILRATALALRVRALRTGRIVDAQRSTKQNLDAMSLTFHHVMESLISRSGNASLHPDERAVLSSIAAGSGSLAEILTRAIDSLDANRDVPESLVAQFLFGCEECGYIAEQSRPEICPACGSIAGEWQMFAPFYSATPEHISRRTPDEIVSMLRDDPAKFREVLEGHSDEELRRSPGPGEWCAKEIAGHMIDIAELFNRRLTALLDPDANVPAEATLRPWKIIEGQNYPEATVDALNERFAAAVAQALGLIPRLRQEDWRKKADMLSGRVPVIDMGSWLVNHNLAHLEQIRARLGGG
jgi:rubrerythrin